MIRWTAHLGPLFREWPLLERFGAAREHGFERVECWSPFDEDVGDFANAVRTSGIQLKGFNLHSGDLGAGERGFLNRRDRRDAVLDNAHRAIDLAIDLGVPQINALVGNSTREPRSEQLDQVAGILSEILRSAEGSGVNILVEALNPDENPAYLLRDVDEAAELVERVAHPQLWLLFDAYHVARSGRNMVLDFTSHHERVAHIHIADSPGRHEPGTGEVDFPGFFEAVTRLKYPGTIGLEYIPRGATGESLSWLPVTERGASPTFPSPIRDTA